MLEKNMDIIQITTMLTNYKTIEDLDKINFKQLPQDERLTIILAIVDKYNDIRQFKDYFSPEDIKLLKDAAKKEIIRYNDEDDEVLYFPQL